MAWNILIVDDSALTRTAIRRIIEMVDEIDAGEIYEAENGLKAIAVLMNNEVDLVLADLNMPKMNGIEMVHRMKNTVETADIPVVVVSTESSSHKIEMLKDQGIAGYLHKPFTTKFTCHRAKYTSTNRLILLIQ